MIISKLHRFIFVAIPKTGTHSVRQALREQMGPEDMEQVGLFVQKSLPIPDLAKIRHGHLTLSQLLRLDEEGMVSVVRSGEGRRGGAGGHAYEVLTPPLPGLRAEVTRHTLAAGAVTGGPGDPPRHEPGARETAVVERGALTLHVDGAEHPLYTGDCVTFDADLPHHFANHSKEEAVLLAIVSAGLRRS